MLLLDIPLGIDPHSSPHTAPHSTFSLAKLPSWVEGRVALMGDASHPMLPFVAQGAAQAVEDAGSIAACLALLEDKSHIRDALEL